MIFPFMPPYLKQDLALISAVIDLECHFGTYSVGVARKANEGKGLRVNRLQSAAGTYRDTETRSSDASQLQSE